MYRSQSFFISEQKTDGAFAPVLISAFKIFTDDSYYHKTDDEERALHPRQTFAFIRCTAGSGRLYTKRGEYALQENDYILLRFHDIIKYKATAQIWSYRWSNFTADSLAELKPDQLLTTPVTEQEEKSFDKLLLFGQNLYDRNYINYLFLDYYYNITAKEKTQAILSQEFCGNKQIDDMCALIAQKVFSRLTVEDVSAFFNISSRRLHQIFSKELDISPKQYILKKKMEEGYRLLVQTSMPINKISELLCFSSPYHFTNEFKKAFAQTPTQVRNMEDTIIAAQKEEPGRKC